MVRGCWTPLKATIPEWVADVGDPVAKHPSAALPAAGEWAPAAVAATCLLEAGAAWADLEGGGRE